MIAEKVLRNTEQEPYAARLIDGAIREYLQRIKLLRQAIDAPETDKNLKQIYNMERLIHENHISNLSSIRTAILINEAKKGAWL